MKGCGRGKRLLSKRFPAPGLSFPPCVYKAGSAVRPAGMPVSGWSGERDGGFSRACGVRHEAVLEVAGWKGFSCNKRFLREAFSAPGPFRHTGRDVCRVRKMLRDSRVPGPACRLATDRSPACMPAVWYRKHRGKHVPCVFGQYPLCYRYRGLACRDTIPFSGPGRNMDFTL